MKLSIIILNYKTKGLLKQCLRGIFDSRLPMPFEIIVVDNDSRDGSLDMIHQYFPGVMTIASPTNVGFAAGMNLGFNQARGEYLMTLNTDIAIFQEAVIRIVEYMDQHSKVGLAAPRLINPDGSVQHSRYRFYRLMTPIYRRTLLGRLSSGQQQLRRFLMRDSNQEKDQPVGWVLGACMLLRRTALQQVGNFDPRFFLYFEDVDLCRRLWQGGWEVHYVASAELVHYHRRLSAETSGLSALFSYPTRIHIQSALKYFAKYLGAPPPPYTV